MLAREINKIENSIKLKEGKHNIIEKQFSYIK